MSTTYLKFASEAEAVAALSQYRIMEGGVEQWLTASHTHALDIVGTIHKPTGVMIPSDQGFPPTPEMAPLPGFHVNAIFTQGTPDSLLPFVITPSSPSRVFA